MLARVCAALLLVAIIAGCAERVEVKTVAYAPGRGCTPLGCYLDGCGYFIVSDSSWTQQMFQSYDYRWDYVLYRMADPLERPPRVDQFLIGDLSGTGVRTLQVDKTDENVDLDVLAHLPSVREALARLRARGCWKKS